MSEEKDFWDKASDFLEKHWWAFAEVCEKERKEKAKQSKEMCDKLRKFALDPSHKFQDEDGNDMTFLKTIPKRIKILKSTHKKK